MTRLGRGFPVRPKYLRTVDDHIIRRSVSASVSVGTRPANDLVVHNTWLWPKGTHSDDFNRADGNVGSDYFRANSPNPPLPQIAGNQVALDNTTGLTGRIGTFGLEQYAETTVAALSTNGSAVGPAVFVSSTSPNHVSAAYNAASSAWFIYFRASDGSGGASGSLSAQVPTVGTKIRIEAVLNASRLKAKLYLDGVFVGVHTVTTASVVTKMSGGSPGFGDAANVTATNAAIDDWSGGDLDTQRPLVVGGLQFVAVSTRTVRHFGGVAATSSAVKNATVLARLAPGGAPMAAAAKVATLGRVPFADDFNRADSSSSLGSAYTITGPGTGVFGVSGNQAYMSSGNVSNRWAVVPAGADCHVQAVRPDRVSDDFRLVARVNAAGTQYVMTQFANGSIFMRDSVPGDTIEVSYTVPTGAMCAIDVVGNEMRVYVNDILVGTRTVQASGVLAGIGGSFLAVTRWEDLSITPHGVVPAMVGDAPQVTAKKVMVAGVPGAQVFADDFNRADGSLGSSWAAGATLQILSNQLKAVGGSGSAFTDPSLQFAPDEWMQFTAVTVPSIRNTAYFRYFDNTKFGFFSYSASDLQWSTSNGVSQAFTSVDPCVISPGDVIRIHVHGAVATAFLNGVLLSTCSLRVPLTEGARVGFFLRSNEIVDDLTVGIMDGNRQVLGGSFVATPQKKLPTIARNALGSRPANDLVVRNTWLWPATRYSDDFNRADGALGVSWLDPDGVFSITSNEVHVSTSNIHHATPVGHVGGLEQYSELTFRTFATDGFNAILPTLFCGTPEGTVSGTNVTYVQLLWSGANTRWEYSARAPSLTGSGSHTSSSGAITAIGTPAAPQAGDRVRFAGVLIPGVRCVLTVCVNGVVVARGDITSSIIRVIPGPPGLGMATQAGFSGLASASSDDWEGGLLAPARPLSLGSSSTAAATRGTFAAAGLSLHGLAPTNSLVTKTAKPSALASTGNAALSVVSKVAKATGLGTHGEAPQVVAKKVARLYRRSYQDDFTHVDGIIVTHPDWETTGSIEYASNTWISNGVLSTATRKTTVGQEQFSQVTVANTGSSAQGVAVRIQGLPTSLGAVSGYVLNRQSGLLAISRIDGGGSGTVISDQGSIAHTAAATDVLRLEAIGERFFGYLNGTLVLTATDRTYSTGNIGVRLRRDTAPGVDDWSGGDLASPAPATTGAGALASVKKKLTTVAPSVLGTRSAVGAVHRLTATASANQGNAQTSTLVTKVSIATASGNVGLQPDGFAARLGQIVYAAAALASGIHDALIRKSASTSSTATVASEALLTAQKVTVAIGLHRAGIGGLLQAAKRAVTLSSSNVGTFSFGQATKIGQVSANQIVGIASRGLTGTVALIMATADHFFGVMQSVVVKKRSTVAANGAVGSDPVVAARKVSVVVAWQNASSAVVGLARKIATLTTTQFGEGTFGEGTFGFSGRTRGNMAIAARATVSQLHQVAASSQGYLGAVASAVTKRISKASATGAIGAAETTTAAKIVSPTATVSTAVQSAGVFTRTINWLGNLTFGQVATGLTRKTSTHTVSLDAPASENARMVKRIGVSGQGDTATAEAATARKVSPVETAAETGVIPDVTARKRSVVITALASGQDLQVTVKKRVTAAVRLASSTYQSALAAKVATPTVEEKTGLAGLLVAQKVSTPITRVATVISHFVFPLFIGIFFGADYLVETSPMSTPWTFGPLTTNWTTELSVASWDIPTDVLTGLEFSDIGTGWQMSEVFNT